MEKVNGVNFELVLRLKIKKFHQLSNLTNLRGQLVTFKNKSFLRK